MEMMKKILEMMKEMDKKLDEVREGTRSMHKKLDDGVRDIRNDNKLFREKLGKERTKEITTRKIETSNRVTAVKMKYQAETRDVTSTGIIMKTMTVRKIRATEMMDPG